jgi:CrcB protein
MSDLGWSHTVQQRVEGEVTTRAGHRVAAVIAAGGMLGAAARHGVAVAVPLDGHGFPWATLWTNVTGSAVLGLLSAHLLSRRPSNWYLRPFLVSGVLGAYTTYSTFVVETDLLIRAGRLPTALVYAAASIAAGCAAAGVGLVLAGRAGRAAVNAEASWN